MLRELDRDRASLGMRSYGLSVTTMEEVFLNVSQTAQAAHAAQATHAAQAVNGVNGDATGAGKDAHVRSLYSGYCTLESSPLPSQVAVASRNLFMCQSCTLWSVSRSVRRLFGAQ